MLFGIYFLE